MKVNRIIRLCMLTIIATIILGSNSSVSAETVTALKDKVYIKIGDSPREVLGLSVTSDDDKNLVLESANEDIVEVTDNKVIGKATGRTEVTASINDELMATVQVIVYDVKADDNKKSEELQASKQIQTAITEILSGSQQEVVDKDTKEKIIEKVNEGKTIKTKLVLDEINENNIEKQAQTIKESIPLGTQVASFYDINLLIKDENNKIGKVDLLQDDINVTLSIPQEIIDSDVQNRVYKVYSFHNNKTEEVDAINNNDGTITIKIKKFSTYALAYEDIRNTERLDRPNNIVGSIENNNIIENVANDNLVQETSVQNNEKMSKVGDVIMVTVSLILLLAIGLFVLYKTRKSKD